MAIATQTIAPVEQARGRVALTARRVPLRTEAATHGLRAKASGPMSRSR